MKTAVLGGGNGAFAAAGDFALAGHDVRMWRRSEADAAAHVQAGKTILVKDFSGKREAKLAMVTSDLAAALDGVELILCPSPATSHADIAKVLAPHLKPGQVVYLPPGTLGSYMFAAAAHEAGTSRGVSFAETGTLPWLTRKHGPYEVAITTRAVRLPTGVFPAVASAEALAVIDKAFPGVIEACGDVLSGALMNAGPIIHPPLIMMNAGPLEHSAKFDIHSEGTQPSIRRVTDLLDQERIAVRVALGYGAPHFPLADHYNQEGNLWMYGRRGHSQLQDSGDWREKIELTSHRYMVEDAQLGLSLIASAAELAGVEVPLTHAFLSIGSAICGVDFMKEGRTLPGVGLGHFDREGVQSLLNAGFA